MSLPSYRPRKGSVLLSIPLVLLSSAKAQKIAVPSANSQKNDEVMIYVPPSDSVRKSRAAYSQAARDWEEKRDKSLVTDISLPKDQMVPRITAEQERTAKMLRGRKAYYESLAKYYDSLGERMSATGQFDTEGQKAVTQQGILMLVDQRQQLEKEIAEAAKEPSIQNLLKEQLRNIERAKRALENDALSLDRIKQGDAAYEQRRVSAVQAQKNLAKTMQSIAENTGDLDKAYETQFRALKSVAGTKVPATGGTAVVGGKEPAAGGTSVAGGKEPAAGGTSVAGGKEAASGGTSVAGGKEPATGGTSVAGGKEPATGGTGGAAAGRGSGASPGASGTNTGTDRRAVENEPGVGVAPSASQVNLNGNWTFRATNKLNDPGVVVLEIKDAAEVIKGHLTMTTAPKSWGAPQFDCDFSGPRTLKGSPGAYTFACNTSDRTGELQFLPNPSKPNLLEVVWNSKGNKDIKFNQLLTR